MVMDMNEQRLAFVREKMGVPDTILCRGDGIRNWNNSMP
jgi:hypothetical protein